MKNKRIKGLLAAAFTASVSLTAVSCDKVKDDNTLLLGLAALGLSQQAGPTVSAVTFKEVSAPSTDIEKASTRISPGVTVKYSDGTEKEFPLTWEVLAYSGDTIGSSTYKFGQAVSKDGDPINAILDDGSATYSNNPDGMSVFKSGNDYYLITQFEDRPGVIYNTKMSLGTDGKFSPVSTAPVNPAKLAELGGTHTNCASSKTPWNTHLASEEDYDLDGIIFSENPTATSIAGSNHRTACDAGGTAYACTTIQGQKNYLEITDSSLINPYHYGYNFEISMTEPESPNLHSDNKHFVFGKSTPENALVLGDKKTVIISEDGGYRVLFKFVADTAGDLSAGTLYAAKLKDVLSDSDTTAEIEWIELGKSSDSVLADIIKKKPDWSDMWDVANQTTKAGCEGAGTGFKYLYAGDYKTCVRPRDGSNGTTVSAKFKDAEEAKLALGFLEARRYAAYLGATAEWNKSEAVAFDKDRNVVWLGLTSIEKSMRKDDTFTNKYHQDDMIQWSADNKCGAVFKLNLDASSNPTSVEMVLNGKPQTADAAGNTCDPDGISGPDNVRYMGYNTLLIGEDTSGHKNNMAWAYNIETKALTRIAHGPLGSELTGMFADVNAGGNHYRFLGIQHPADYTGSTYVWGSNERKGIVGYIKGMPELSFTEY